MRTFGFPILASLIVLAGCGSDEESTTTPPTSTQTATSTTHDPGEGAVGGPEGTLDADGIGAVKIGASDDEVATAFAAYDAYTTELETADGIRVGDPDSLLQKRYGDDLIGSPLGVHAVVLSAKKPGTTESPALTFAIDGKNISAISGGQVVQPAGE